MKNPKKLTRNQKVKLSKKHLEPDDYLFIREDVDTFTVQKRSKLGTKEGIVTLNK